MTTFSFAEGCTISIGTLRSTFNALCSTKVAAQASYPAVSFHNSPPSPETCLFPYPPLSLPLYSATPQDTSEDAIEDLAEGLDVLLILERAYELALKGHVIAPSTQVSTPSLPMSSKWEPLTGFSTALVTAKDGNPQGLRLKSYLMHK
jgi:hypothetical protein